MGIITFEGVCVGIILWLGVCVWGSFSRCMCRKHSLGGSVGCRDHSLSRYVGIRDHSSGRCLCVWEEGIVLLVGMGIRNRSPGR